MAENSDSSSSPLPVTNGLKKTRPESAWANAIKNMSPIWFTLSMNTGIISILMYNLPWQFDGLHIISGIFYCFNILLFIVFLIAFTIRWTLYRNIAIEKTAGDIDEIAMLGALPIAFLTLVGSTALIPTNASWGGYGFTILAIIMFWIATAMILFTACGVFITFFRTRVFDDRTSTPTIMIPMVGTATNAVIGGLVSQYAYNIPPSLAVPIIIVSYMLVGIGFLGSIFLYQLFFHRLIAVGFPPGPKTPGLFMLVGPFGQAAAALTLLGSSASMGNFAAYKEGTFLQSTSGMTVSSAGIMIALMSVGMDFFWLAVAIWGVLEAVWRRDVQYSLIWWALIFPLATVTTTFSGLSEALDSDAFRGLTAAFLLILVIQYVFNWAFTIWHSIRGQLLVKRDEKKE